MRYFTKVSFANVYRKPSFHSEVDTQTFLWEGLETQEKLDSFWRVRTQDGYEGWVNEHQITYAKPPQADWQTVSVPIGYIYGEPNKNAAPIMGVSAGTTLPVIKEEGDWAQIVLPDERKGWVERRILQALPALTPDQLVEKAKEFLGTTYIWGGKTAFGLDCSGFVQLLFKLFGKPLRRDAWMQFEDAQPVSKDPLQARKGDLYFFAENGNKITHVGLALGQGKMIHARGQIKINSLVEGADDFDPNLLKDFVEVRSYFKK